MNALLTMDALTTDDCTAGRNMQYALISAAAFVAAVLAFFSGFGLGTVLLPAFALFLPPRIAVAMTAVVHLANSLFKVALIGRRANLSIVLRFGVPAIVAAFAGAKTLGWISGLAPLVVYSLAGRTLEVTPINLVIAILMGVFAILEAWPRYQRVAIDPKYLPGGGLLSGFFGGISGHQGAFRSIFLLRAGINKEAFIGTTTVIAALVDLTRLAVYQSWFSAPEIRADGPLLAAAVAAALAGSAIANRLLPRVTLRSIQIIVAILLAGIAVALGMGLI